MKDQVDNLADRGITDAVTINGLLDPISRSLAIERVQSGEASLLYIAPEMLRSKTIEKILLGRHVVRFVIDEAHCFSAWGQDFRVDYLYIGKFISEYQRKKGCRQPIPVSCFTATAKQKVIQDICDYFRQTLYLHLDIYASAATRTNLHYAVIHADTDEDKYQKLRARNRLFIHTNGDLFDRLPADSHRTDACSYPLPEEMVLQLSHKDVNLGFFKPIKQQVLALRSGDPLLPSDNYFLQPSTGRAVAKLSAGMQEKLASWRDRGYSPSAAAVRFVVAWKPKDAAKEEPETDVLLIDLTLSMP